MLWTMLRSARRNWARAVTSPGPTQSTSIGISVEVAYGTQVSGSSQIVPGAPDDDPANSRAAMQNRISAISGRSHGSAWVERLVPVVPCRNIVGRGLSWSLSVAPGFVFGRLPEAI